MATNVSFRHIDGRTRTLGMADGLFTDPVDGPIIDATALYAVRGLVDAHSHIASDSLADAIPSGRKGSSPGDRTPRDRAWSQLESGVFLLYDKGAGDRAHLSILSEPPTSRPDMEMAGTILYPPGGYYPGFSPRELDLDDLIPTVATEAEAPAKWVKVIGDWPRPHQGAVPNFTGDQLARVVEIAHSAGCRVAIHAAAPHTSTMAVAAGVDSIEHGLFLTEDDIRALGARGGAWVPTIAAMSGVRDSLRPDSSGWRLFDEGLANARQLLVPAIKAGVVVLAGTDLTVPHGQVAMEGLTMAEAGLPATEVVHVLTEAGFAYGGLGEAFRVGGSADLVAFAADPRDDIGILLDPILVMRRGELIVDRR